MADSQFIYEQRKVNSSTAWLLYLLLGWSHGYVEKSIGMQILFYITGGGFGVWALVRLFTLSGAIKEANKKIAAQAGISSDDMLKMGLL